MDVVRSFAWGSGPEVYPGVVATGSSEANTEDGVAFGGEKQCGERVGAAATGYEDAIGWVYYPRSRLRVFAGGNVSGSVVDNVR